MFLGATDLEKVNFNNRDVKQNLRRARRGGVSCDELRVWDPDFVPEEKTRLEIERGIDLWRTNRHGRQIASVSSLRFRITVLSLTDGFSHGLASILGSIRATDATSSLALVTR